jgi:hypothetical protein
MSQRSIVWSYGGGKQTAAIAVLIARGLLPKPDVAVIADTGRENPATFAYLRDTIQPLLDTVGVTVEIAPPTLAMVGLYGKNGDLLIPAHTRTGKLPAFCSGEWKREVVGRYLRSIGYGPERPVVEWIGFSTDEAHRAKRSRTKWRQQAFPLLTMWPMRRDECVALVRAAGLPDAPKSRCYDCPNQTNEEWREVQAQPRLWQIAVSRDKAIRARDTQGGVFLHHEKRPLDEVDLSKPDQSDMFTRCDGVGCFT